MATALSYDAAMSTAIHSLHSIKVMLILSLTAAADIHGPILIRLLV